MRILHWWLISNCALINWLCSWYSGITIWLGWLNGILQRCHRILNVLCRSLTSFSILQHISKLALGILHSRFTVDWWGCDIIRILNRLVTICLCTCNSLVVIRNRLGNFFSRCILVSQNLVQISLGSLRVLINCIRVLRVVHHELLDFSILTRCLFTKRWRHCSNTITYFKRLCNHSLLVERCTATSNIVVIKELICLQSLCPCCVRLTIRSRNRVWVTSLLQTCIRHWTKLRLASPVRVRSPICLSNQAWWQVRLHNNLLIILRWVHNHKVVIIRRKCWVSGHCFSQRTIDLVVRSDNFVLVTIDLQTSFDCIRHNHRSTCITCWNNILQVINNGSNGWQLTSSCITSRRLLSRICQRHRCCCVNRIWIKWNHCVNTSWQTSYRIRTIGILSHRQSLRVLIIHLHWDNVTSLWIHVRNNWRVTRLVSHLNRCCIARYNWWCHFSNWHLHNFKCCTGLHLRAWQLVVDSTIFTLNRIWQNLFCRAIGVVDKDHWCLTINWWDVQISNIITFTSRNNCWLRNWRVHHIQLLLSVLNVSLAWLWIVQNLLQVISCVLHVLRQRLTRLLNSIQVSCCILLSRIQSLLGLVFSLCQGSLRILDFWSCGRWTISQLILQRLLCISDSLAITHVIRYVCNNLLSQILGILQCRFSIWLCCVVGVLRLIQVTLGAIRILGYLSQLSCRIVQWLIISQLRWNWRINRVLVVLQLCGCIINRCL